MMLKGLNKLIIDENAKVRDLTVTEEQKLREKIQSKLHFPFRVTFSYVDAIERSPTQKFEEFKSMIGGSA